MSTLSEIQRMREEMEVGWRLYQVQREHKIRALLGDDVYDFVQGGQGRVIIDQMKPDPPTKGEAMSYTTDVLLYVGYSGDKGLEPFLDALMKNDERYGATLLPLDTDAANGPRSFGGAVLAQGGNHFPAQDMQRLLDSVRWNRPGDVVLICATEHKITEVLRPTFVEEYGGHWNAEVRAVQPPVEEKS